MSKSKTSTQRNWESLQRIAQAFFMQLRASHPEWSREDLFEVLSVAPTGLLCEMADRSGFRPKSDASGEEIAEVAARCLAGTWSDVVISQQTGIPLQRVRKVLSSLGVGYGSEPYGNRPYGSRRKRSDGRSLVERKVTVTGQMSYKGELYSLGKRYRGRVAKIREERDLLVVSFPDLPTLRLPCRD